MSAFVIHMAIVDRTLDLHDDDLTAYEKLDSMFRRWFLCRIILNVKTKKKHTHTFFFSNACIDDGI